MLIENNPFTPSFGRVPPYMAGRQFLMSDFARAFRGNGNDPLLQSIVVGARGTGKTAVLSAACDLALGEGWLCVSTTCAPGMLDDIFQQTVFASSELVDVRKGATLTGVSIGQLFGFEWKPSEDAPANWRLAMSKLLDQLAETGTGLVITVDEVRPGVAEMEQLAAVFQHFVRERRRTALLMAGLPHQAVQLVNSGSVSFLRRAMSISLGRIDDADVGEAFRKTVESGGKSIGAQPLGECVKAIDGFAYMLQLVGFRAWEASGEAKTIAAEDAARGISLAQADLERQIIVPTWASLSAVDKEFCRALAAGARTAKEIGERLGKKPNFVSKYKQRLLEQGVVDQDAYANLRFSLPCFEAFVQREVAGAE